MSWFDESGANANNTKNKDHDLATMLNRKAAAHIHIQDMTFDFGEWSHALSVNRTLESVAICVSMASLPMSKSCRDLFRALGKLPKLQTLRFLSSTENGAFGMYCWRCPLNVLTIIFQQKPAKLRTFHIQDVEFRGQDDENALTKLAESLSRLPLLQEFSMAHCRFVKETSLSILDPVLQQLLLMSGSTKISGEEDGDTTNDSQTRTAGIQKIILSATRVDALGGPMQHESLCQIFAHHHQQQPLSVLKELRLLKFDFSTKVLVPLLGVLMGYPCLEKLLLSRCQWDASVIRVLSKLLRGNGNINNNNMTTITNDSGGSYRGLRELHLLGNCDFLRGNNKDSVECHGELVQALLESPSMRRFFVEPMQPPPRRSRTFLIEPLDEEDEEDEFAIPISCQKLYLRAMHHNYALEEFRMVHLFAPRWHGLIEFYLRLNQAGRRVVMLDPDSINGSHIRRMDDLENDKRAWINAIAAVNDDVACIFYFLANFPLLVQGAF